jgi:hypothetical protein
MKKFNVGTVLSVTTGFLLAPRGIEEMYEIIDYTLDVQSWTHMLPALRKPASEAILEQHPYLDTPEVKSAVDKVVAKIKAAPDSSEAKQEACALGLEEFVYPLYGRELDLIPKPLN